MKRKLFAFLATILFVLSSTIGSFAASGSWQPTPSEMFRDAGLIIYDNTTTAVVVFGEMVPNPNNPAFNIAIPCFYSVDGKKLGEMDWQGAGALRNKYYQTNKFDPFDGEMWLVNAFNDYRGVARSTLQDNSTFWENYRLKEKAARAAEVVPNIGKITWQEMFSGMTITVLNNTSQAVYIGSFDAPIIATSRMNFFDASHNIIGYISGADYETLYNRGNAVFKNYLNRIPGGDGGWYAQLFNDYRGVTRETADQYIDRERINREAIEIKQWNLLEQIYGKSIIRENSLKTEQTVEVPNYSENINNNNAAGSKPATNDTSNWASKVVELTNAERAGEGLAALQQDTKLSELAAIRAKELVELFSHTRPNGDRAIIWAKEESGFSGVGENVAYGYRSPELVLDGWMNSEGHRENILRSNYKAMGAGYYQDPATGIMYWVQLFAY